MQSTTNSQDKGLLIDWLTQKPNYFIHNDQWYTAKNISRDCLSIDT